MSDQIFYVGAQDPRQRLSGYVPAKFLTINGQPVVDPLPRGSQDAFLYVDDKGNQKTKGVHANPNNYLIVPANYSEQRARAFAAEIADTLAGPYLGDETGGAGVSQALGKMTHAFWQGGPQDLQRHPQWGIPDGSFVPAFRSSASYHLGTISGWAGLPIALPRLGGALANEIHAAEEIIKSYRHHYSAAAGMAGKYLRIWLTSENSGDRRWPDCS